MVCLPAERAVELVGELPAEVEVVTWDGGSTAPAGVAHTRFWVPAFGWGPGTDPAQTMQTMPRLEVIQVISAGVDSTIGHVPAGVVLCDGRGVHGGSTSEWVLAVILASQRELPRFVRGQDQRHWDHTTTDELGGKRVLVVGAGDLGDQTARRLRAFDAEPVLVARTARDGVHGVDELPALLPDADIVVLVVPKTQATTGMVDEQFLSRMRDGALLVNGARGSVVVTDDLVARLHTGRLRAALDVTDPEPLPPEHPLWSAPNVLITPHVGGSVLGFPRRAYALVRAQIERYAAGTDLINIVTGDY